MDAPTTSLSSLGSAQISPLSEITPGQALSALFPPTLALSSSQPLALPDFLCSHVFAFVVSLLLGE